MTGVVLQTKAEAVVNKGGGRPTRTIRQEIDLPFAGKKSVLKHQECRQRVSGSDYVIFHCPACDRRNKYPVQQAKGQTSDGRLSFRCKGCYREVEVARPQPPILATNFVDVQDGRIVGAGLLDPNGRPIGGE